MFNFYNDEATVKWAIGQVDWRGGATIFGVPLEGQGISFFTYENEVQGLILTSHASGHPASNKLIGSAGTIEVSSNATAIRVWGKGDTDWREIQVAPEPGENLGEVVGQGVLDMVEALKTHREPELSARHALRATELIFATYESSRRGARIDFPLEALASPFPGLTRSTQ